jgi:hypothetical protein
MTAEHREGAHQGWNVKLRLAIDADNADEAGAIAAEVWRKMEVTSGAEPQITRSGGRAPHWTSSPTWTCPPWSRSRLMTQ